MEVVTRKKLIEVALPLDAINRACANEANPFTPRHPRSLHVWWARRRLAAARAIIFAQMVDDPSSHRDQYRTDEAQEKERQRLFRIIEELVLWENTTNERVLNAAREEVRRSWRWTCEDNKNHPRAKELFDPATLPAFHDPFAGGGALPLEAQRLGLESYASDLNPVAVLINKAMIEVPSRFAEASPVNPEAQRLKSGLQGLWRGASGLAEDVRYYSEWMQGEAEKRIGNLYPQIEITKEMADSRPDLAQYVGTKLVVTAWLWARTVKSPNPAFAQVEVPLASTFILSTKPGREAYVEPRIEENGYSFSVKLGKPNDAESAKRGTKSGGSGSSFRCLMSGTPMPFEFLRAEAKAGRMGARLLAMVAEGEHGRIYLEPSREAAEIASMATPTNVPETDLPAKALGFRVQEYGMTRWRDLFTPRQLVSLTTFTDLVQVSRERVKQDAIASAKPSSEKGKSSLEYASAYADSVALYLGMAVSRWTDLFNSLVTWNITNQNIKNLFARQAIPMAWDYCESNPFGSGASFRSTADSIVRLFASLPATPQGNAMQLDAAVQNLSAGKVICTDPPYFDNIGYADLSDFFYVWLRRALQPSFPDLFATVAVPKHEELVATPFRHGNKDLAEKFFLTGMTHAMQRLAVLAHPAFPMTIFYAFKQTETDDEEGSASTGWETFLDAVIRAGLCVEGTWPVRTERTAGIKGSINALASSIVLVCRPRSVEARTATRRDFSTVLRAELPQALLQFQQGNIAPVDLAQAAIGPGMAVYTRYATVLEADGSPMPVRAALQIINQELDAILSSADTDYDADTRWALKWFDQCGHEDGSFDNANTYASAMNVGVNGLVESGVVVARGGKVRLLRRSELHGGSPLDWDPTKDKSISAWEAVQHIIHRHQEQGVEGAAALVSVLGSRADVAKDLAYRLYNICDRKKWQAEALAYNALVAEWNDIVQASTKSAKPAAGSLFG